MGGGWRVPRDGGGRGTEANQYFAFLSICKCHQETKSNFSSIIKGGSGVAAAAAASEESLAGRGTHTEMEINRKNVERPKEALDFVFLILLRFQGLFVAIRSIE